MAILKVKDKDGKVTEIPAIVGPPGKDGKSAYEYAKDGGYAGTEEDFAEKLSEDIVGKSTAGKSQTPYSITETGVNTDDHQVIETPLDPVVAEKGAEIFNDYDGNVATGFYAYAAGYKTQATGNYSRSNGWWTIAGGQCSNAEGLLSTASGHFAHAEGIRTKATANNSHSEGDSTTASGRQSHAEGQGTVASGFCSHAEGSNTKATNYYAHSEGLGTIAAGRNQNAMGKYNVSDTTSLLIIGNGTSDTKRSNAMSVSEGGDGWFAKDVYVGSTSGTKKDAGSVKLAKITDLPTIDDELNEESENPIQNKAVAKALNDARNSITLIDSVTGKKYAISIANGSLTMSEVTE